MATEQVLLDLQAVIEACLADKLQAGFDANSALTVDIATQVAKEIELRAAEYTDDEIAKLTDLIGGGDLKPLIDLLTTIRDLLDGDGDTSDGFDTFNKLVADIADNKQTLVNHTTSISLIQATLANYDAQLTDHENRLLALEAIDHTKTNCEDCHDGILTLVKDSMQAACTAASDTINAYTAQKSEEVSTAFADQLDPISLAGTAIVDLEGFVQFTGEVISGRRPKTLVFRTPNSIVGEHFDVDANGKVAGTLVERVDTTAPAITIAMFAKDADGTMVGQSIDIVAEMPTTPPPVVSDPLPPAV